MTITEYYPRDKTTGHYLQSITVCINRMHWRTGTGTDTLLRDLIYNRPTIQVGITSTSIDRDRCTEITVVGIRMLRYAPIPESKLSDFFIRLDSLFCFIENKKYERN